MKKLAIVLFAFGLTIWADSATIVPDGDVDINSWITSPIWGDIDEDIDSPNDSDYGQSPNNPDELDDVNFDVTCPGDLETLTEATMRIRADRTSGSRDISLFVSWSASGSPVVFANNLNSGSPTTYTSPVASGLSIDKATCDASILTASPSTSGGGGPSRANIYTLNLDITYIAGEGGGVARRRIIVIE